MEVSLGNIRTALKCINNDMRRLKRLKNDALNACDLDRAKRVQELINEREFASSSFDRMEWDLIKNNANQKAAPSV